MAIVDQAQAIERMESRHGRLLQVGVALAAAVIAIGGIVYLLKYGGQSPAYGRFQGEPDDLRGLTGVLRAAAAFRGRGLIQLGLLLLIVTPVTRVALSLVAFARQRDWVYVWICSIVLGLLLLSLFGKV